MRAGHQLVQREAARERHKLAGLVGGAVHHLGHVRAGACEHEGAPLLAELLLQLTQIRAGHNQLVELVQRIRWAVVGDGDNEIAHRARIGEAEHRARALEVDVCAAVGDGLIEQAERVAHPALRCPRQ